MLVSSCVISLPLAKIPDEEDQEDPFQKSASPAMLLAALLKCWGECLGSA